MCFGWKKPKQVQNFKWGNSRTSTGMGLWRTDYRKQSHSWRSYSCSVSDEDLRLLWNSKVRYRIDTTRHWSIPSARLIVYTWNHLNLKYILILSSHQLLGLSRFLQVFRQKYMQFSTLLHALPMSISFSWSP